MTGGFRPTPLAPQRRLRSPERHLQKLAAWAEAFDGVFPSSERLCVHWHLPVDGRLVDPPWGQRDLQRRALQLLLDAAARVRRARPADRAHQCVYALVPWPEPCGSEFGVFLDPAYAHDFERRDHPLQIWTRLDSRERSLAGELGLTVPPGFCEIGHHERCEDEDPDSPGGLLVSEREIWLFREPLAEPGHTSASKPDVS